VRLVGQTTAQELVLRAWDAGTELKEEMVISVWVDGKRAAHTSTRNLRGEVQFTYRLPGSGAKTFTLYLPYLVRLEPIALGVPDGAVLTPVPPWPYVWAAHGDSITQGRCASDPGLTYVEQAARLAGVEALNLGYRGWAKGDPGVAHTLAKIPCDIISILMGVNLRWGEWMDAPAWREVFRNFIELVRRGHPDTPLLVISILTCHGEITDTTPSERGVTVKDLRDVEHEVVARMVAAGDKHLRLVDGSTVIGPHDANLVPDGVHPNDAGMTRIAERIAPVIRELLKRR